jgi:carbamoyl-phosphate synthase large subunit
MIPSRSKLSVALDKRRFYRFLKKEKVSHPRTRFPSSYRELDGAEFPLVLKGTVRGRYIPKNREELKVYWKKLEQWSGEKPIVQEFVNGSQYCIAGIANQSHSVEASVQMRKLALAESGASLSGVTLNDPRLESLTKDLVRKLKWVGPFEVECMNSEESNDFKVIEFNTRFPAWIYLATRAGINLPQICVDMAMGQDLPGTYEYSTGLVYIRNAIDSVYPVDTLGELLSTGRHVRNVVMNSLQRNS